MIQTDVLMLRDVVNDLDVAVTDHEIDDLETWLECWAEIEKAAGLLATVRKNLTNRLAESMPDKRITVMGTGTFVKHAKPNRKQWDTEDLLRAVLDTKRKASNGEPLEETQMQKVLHVWHLGAPRLTALRERGFTNEAIDEFCHTEWAGYSLAVES